MTLGSIDMIAPEEASKVAMFVLAVDDDAVAASMLISSSVATLRVHRRMFIPALLESSSLPKLRNSMFVIVFPLEATSYTHSHLPSNDVASDPSLTGILST